MILALAALVGAALTAAACYAAGAMLIDRLGLSGGQSGGWSRGSTLRRFERLPLAFLLGAACLHLAVFAILALHIAYWPVLTLLLLGVIASAVATGSWRLRGEPDAPLSLNLKRVCFPLFGMFTLLYFFHAWAPEISPDGSGYHLGYVASYLRAHGFERVTTDMYATLSGGVEMLFVPAFAIGEHSAAALVHLAFTAALALAMLAYGRRLGAPWAGAAGAFLTYASPVVGIDGSSAYNDVGVAAVVFSAFYWLEIWDASGTGPERPSPKPEASDHPAATGSVAPLNSSSGTGPVRPSPKPEAFDHPAATGSVVPLNSPSGTGPVRPAPKLGTSDHPAATGSVVPLNSPSGAGPERPSPKPEASDHPAATGSVVPLNSPSGTGPVRPAPKLGTSDHSAATGSVMPLPKIRDGMALVPVGLMAGYAYAAKYTAFVMVLFALGFVAWRAWKLGSRKLRPLATVVLFSSLMIAPWMLKNWIIVRNPIAPFGNAIFRNPYFHPIFEKEYSDALRSYDVTDKRTLPLELTIRGGKTQGVLGMTFLAAPLALLALRYRHGRRLLAAGLVMGVPYFANIGTRFLIPPLPFVSLAMALGIGSAPGIGPPLLAALMIFHGVTSWPDELRRYADRFAWRLDHILFSPALRLIPQEQYLRKNDVDYGAARLVEATVPQGERILGLRGVPYAYCKREFLVSYQGALNQTLIDFINVAIVEDYGPTVVESFKFPERTMRRVRVVQTAKINNPDVQWSVHEVRFFHHGMELPRRPQWRLRAWPNPWEVQLAFDNSLATRWRTWESVKPGDFLEVDFGAEQQVDEVRLDTSPDYYEIRLQVEALDSNGKWVRLAQDPKVAAADHETYSLRRAATYEMKARGIHYLVIGEDSFGADDIRDDPGAWGLAEVASGYGIRIFKVAQ
jgi:hypothetical protein